MLSSRTVSTLEYPIDAMFLIHKALSAEAAQLEEMVRTFELGSTVQPVHLTFDTWASLLVFHAEQEDLHMTAPMPDFPPARDNEAEHATLGEIISGLTGFLSEAQTPQLEQRIKAAIAALQEEQHAELLARLEDVMSVLHQEIGRGQVIARTQRHLYQRVVALRVAQDDHFECEEEFVLPEVRRRFTEEQQLEMVRMLLVDEQAEDSRWVIDWLNSRLTPGEQELLAGLTARFGQAAAAH